MVIRRVTALSGPIPTGTSSCGAWCSTSRVRRWLGPAARLVAGAVVGHAAAGAAPPVPASSVVLVHGRPRRRHHGEGDRTTLFFGSRTADDASDAGKRRRMGLAATLPVGVPFKGTWVSDLGCGSCACGGRRLSGPPCCPAPARSPPGPADRLREAEQPTGGPADHRRPLYESVSSERRLPVRVLAPSTCRVPFPLHVRKQRCPASSLRHLLPMWVTFGHVVLVAPSDCSRSLGQALTSENGQLTTLWSGSRLFTLSVWGVRSCEELPD